MPPDLEDGDKSPRPAAPDANSLAALADENQKLKESARKHNAERLVFAIVILIIWDAHTFKSYESWAPVICLTVLEAMGLFILAWRLEMHEVVALFWGVMKSYGKQDPGEPPK